MVGGRVQGEGKEAHIALFSAYYEQDVQDPGIIPGNQYSLAAQAFPAM